MSEQGDISTSDADEASSATTVTRGSPEKGTNSAGTTPVSGFVVLWAGLLVVVQASEAS